MALELTNAQVVAGAGVLIGAIGTLLKVVHSHFKETKAALEEQKAALEEQKAEQHATLLELTGKVGRLEGEREGIATGVELVSAKVIEEVRALQEKC